MNQVQTAPKAQTKGGAPGSWYQIQAKSNHVEILIYGDIGSQGGTAAKVFAEKFFAITKDTPDIVVRISSRGGDISEGLSIYNLLHSYDGRVIIKIDGLAASMASVIAMAGNEIQMPENSMMMIHKPWGIQGGEAGDMRSYADLLDKYEAQLLSIYAKKTGVETQEIEQLLSAETWMTAEEAVERGFADTLIDDIDIKPVATVENIEGYTNMPKAAGQFFKQPKAQAPNTPEGQPEQPGTPKASDAETDTAQARLNGIKQVFASHPTQQGLYVECLANNAITVEMAKDKLLKALGKSHSPSGSHPPHDAGNCDGQAEEMLHILSARAGLEKLEERKSQFRSMSLLEMGRQSILNKGGSIQDATKLGVAGEIYAHSSSDFPHILENLVHKSMMKGFDTAQETYHLWTKKGVLPDFRESKRVDLTAIPSLDKLPEGGDYKEATISDTGEKVILSTYGKVFRITRQALINDDLDAFVKIPHLMGAAAKRTLGNLVYAILLDNPKMSDDKPLFSNDHGNLMTASGLSVDALDKAAAMMAIHQNAEGDTLNIEPGFLILPRALRSKGLTLVKSGANPDAANNQVINPVQDLATVITDGRIDNHFRNAALPWFLTATQEQAPIEISYLDGEEEPFLDQQVNWSNDGTEYKVRLDAGVKAISSRGIVKNPGIK